jgi:hypothetical protein
MIENTFTLILINVKSLEQYLNVEVNNLHFGPFVYLDSLKKKLVYPKSITLDQTSILHPKESKINICHIRVIHPSHYLLQGVLCFVLL